MTCGAGRFYSNGVDLDWLREAAQTDPAQVIDFHAQKGRSIYWRLLTFPITTVAMVNGR